MADDPPHSAQLMAFRQIKESCRAGSSLSKASWSTDSARGTRRCSGRTFAIKDMS